MNREKWAKYDRISLLRYLTKLTEENGEVASELSDLCDLPARTSEMKYPERKHVTKSGIKRLRKMDDELDHVIFIATQMRNRVRMEREIMEDELEGME